MLIQEASEDITKWKNSITKAKSPPRVLPRAPDMRTSAEKSTSARGAPSKMRRVTARYSLDLF